jgi:long-subunit acyl-CoA synthetase (AMP-forming)
LTIIAFPTLEWYAKASNIQYASREEQVKRPKIEDFYQKRVNEASNDLARFEKIKKFTFYIAAFHY